MNRQRPSITFVSRKPERMSRSETFAAGAEAEGSREGGRQAEGGSYEGDARDHEKDRGKHRSAVIASDQRLAVVLHRLWVTGDVYEPRRREAAA